MENIYFNPGTAFDDKPWNDPDLMEYERRKSLNNYAIQMFEQTIQDLVQEKNRFLCSNDKKIIKTYLIKMLNDFITQLNQKEDHHDEFRIADKTRPENEKKPNMLTICIDEAFKDDVYHELISSDQRIDRLLQAIKKESEYFEKCIVWDDESGYLIKEDSELSKSLENSI